MMPLSYNICRCIHIINYLDKLYLYRSHCILLNFHDIVFERHEIKRTYATLKGLCHEWFQVAQSGTLHFMNQHSKFLAIPPVFFYHP